MVSGTLCNLPWTHLEATQLGEVRPCCMWEGESLGKVEDFGKIDFQNHPTLRQVRCQMLKGEKPAGCCKCFLMEDTSNGMSPRVSELTYSNVKKEVKQAINTAGIDGTLVDPKLYSVNFRFNAYCNLACRICGPWASTRWNKDFDTIHAEEGIDHRMYPVNSETQSESVFQEFVKNLDSIQDIVFAGGEPLLQKEHYLILEEIIKRKKTGVKIRYNTNGTVLGLQEFDVISLWRECLALGNSIQVDLSLDGIGKTAEYLRYGCNWDVVCVNVQQLLELQAENRKNFTVCLCPTVSILNIYRFVELLQWGIENQVITEDLRYVTINNFVTSPPWYDIRILPASQKLGIKLELEKHLGKYECVDKYIISTINFMQGTVPDAKWHQKEFYKYTKRLDILRNQNFLDINPEFEVWYNFLDRRYRKEVLDNWIV